MNTKRQIPGGIVMPNKQQQEKFRAIPLVQLIPINLIDPARARQLKDLAQFIAHGTRTARRALRFNAEAGQQVHPSTQGALHFLQGLAQEFEGVARAIRG